MGLNGRSIQIFRDQRKHLTIIKSFSNYLLTLFLYLISIYNVRSVLSTLRSIIINVAR